MFMSFDLRNSFTETNKKYVTFNFGKILERSGQKKKIKQDTSQQLVIDCSPLKIMVAEQSYRKRLILMKLL